MTAARLDSDPAPHAVLSAELARELCAETGLTVAELAQRLVPYAKQLARPVLSGFPVGAVALGTSGALYYGANLEFAGTALPFTVHAEQSVTTNAWNHGEEGLPLLAVSAAPCGYCRQFLWETAGAGAMEVHVGTAPATSLSPGLLPAPFGPRDLDVAAALLTPQQVALTLDEPDD
ncbi:MAG TPA: cytidine deaminase, partial [Baekduia sp.]